MAGRKIAILVVLLIGALAFALVTSGCGTSGGSEGTLDGSSPDQSAEQDSTAPGDEATVAVYFIKGDSFQKVSRATEKAGPEQALKELLKGPDDEEERQGISTAIPEGTRLKSFSIEDKAAIADFSGELRNYGGGSAMVRAITQQISDTVTSNDPSIGSVQITVEGVDAEEALQP